MLDGLVGTVQINGNTTQAFPVTQWRTDLYTRTFIDTNGDGVSQPDELGLSLVNTNIHYRDGSIGFFNNTDMNGYAGFNEVFPFMTGSSSRRRPRASSRPASTPCTTPAVRSIARNRRTPLACRAATSRRTSPAPPSACRCRRICASPAPGTATARIVLSTTREVELRPVRSSAAALGHDAGLAGAARAEQLHRVRREAVQGVRPGRRHPCRERRHQRHGHLRVDAAVRRPRSVAAAPVGARCPARQGQSVQEGSRRLGQREVDAGRHHPHDELGRLGAGLPHRRRRHDAPHRRGPAPTSPDTCRT